MLETERPDLEAPEPESLETQFWAPRPVPRPNVGRGGGGGARGRLHEWRSDARVGVVALVLIAVGAGFIWYRMGLASGGTRTTGATTATSPGQRQSAAPTGSHAAGSAGNRTTTSTTANGARASAKVVVHVAGAVTKPGVVELRAGARVIDAVEAAGGALPQADLDRLNLAAKLIDGQRVLVQKVGDPPAVAEPAAVTGSDAAGSGAGDQAAGGPINLNTATQAELEALPGIGPTLAKAILDERQHRGGFRSVNELREVRGIGARRFADLQSRLTV
jgi:competence protein ComEA